MPDHINIHHPDTNERWEREAIKMNAKLLPCPFCWSSASLETAVTANVGGEEIQYVTCVECSAQADPHDWQTRPEAPAPVQREVGRD